MTTFFMLPTLLRSDEGAARIPDTVGPADVGRAAACSGPETSGRLSVRRQPSAVRIRPRVLRVPVSSFLWRAPGAGGGSRAAEFLADRRIGVVGLRYSRVVRELDLDLVGSGRHGCVVLRGDGSAVHARR